MKPCIVSMSIYDHLVINTPLEYSNKFGIQSKLSIEPSSSYEAFEIYDHDFFNAIANSPKQYKKGDSLSDLVIVEDEYSSVSNHPVVVTLMDDKYNSWKTRGTGITGDSGYTRVPTDPSISIEHFSMPSTNIDAIPPSLPASSASSSSNTLPYKQYAPPCNCQNKKISHHDNSTNKWDLQTKIYVSSLTVVGLYIFFRVMKQSNK